MTVELLLPLKRIFDQSLYQFLNQDPEWLLRCPEKTPILIARDQSSNMISYAALEFKPFRTVHIAFGPITTETLKLAEIISQMVDWLTKQSKWRLTIQLPVPLHENGNEIAAQLQQLTSFRQSEYFFNWKSWWLSIDKKPELLLQSFSNHHQKSVRQGIKQDVRCQPITTSDQVLLLAELYIEMYQHRKLRVNRKSSRQLFLAINQYILECKKGLMLEIIIDDRMVGGIVIIFQGNTAYYYLGVTTVNYRRSVPFLYIAFYKVIEHCWHHGIHMLDFGGFAVGEKEGSQLFNINKFKMGFGGRLVDYPRQMVFDLNPLFSHGIEKGIQLRNNLRKWRQKK